MRSKTMTDAASLLADLQRLVQFLKADLLERSGELPEVDAGLRAAHQAIVGGGRTAQAFEEWRDDYLEQVAVAWVLACVFVRYMEDNDLITETYLAGTGDRRRRAEDAHEGYFRAHPRDSDRDYLLHVFRKVGSIPAARDLFAEGKTPVWAVGPSGDGAARLLAFWREVDSEVGGLRRSLQVEGSDTRFLGDLYQDLSEAARKKYALLQTPEFVEEFILDHTLTPSIDEFGLEAVRLIDPTCGSGHFLLGAFRRLFRFWSEREPGTDPTVLAQRALDAVNGVDVNPFAVAIARFRLIVESMHLCGVTRMEKPRGWTVHVATGDSLMHGDTFDRRGFRQEWLPGDEPWSDPLFALEDPSGLAKILDRQYHAVVGNPPYITVKDARLNDRYRARWGTCHRQYSLGVPFTERFFDLALTAEGPRPAGFVGMITANSFMKREFGKKLIEAFFPTVDLTHVIDTSGAYIPGHGTPTVILFGHNRRPGTPEVRAVLGIRGEPTTPDDPARGLVWRSIVDHLESGQAQNEFVSVTTVDRGTFGKHPWSIGGGGVAEVQALIETKASCRLMELTVSIGRVAHTGSDEAYIADAMSLSRRRVGKVNTATFVEGDRLRDYVLSEPTSVLFPYGANLKPIDERLDHPVIRWLLAFRDQLWERREPNGTHREIGKTWHEFSRFHPERYVGPGIAFAFVATHNHFVLDRGGKVFKQSAPIIKLPADASEDDHLALVGLLNSSTACFWMKQGFHSKGSQGINEGLKAEYWEQFFEFSGTGVGAYPVLDSRNKTLPLSRKLVALARLIVELSPTELVKRDVPTAERLAANRAETEQLQARMVALQEELDWLCYRLYGLLDEPLDDVGQPPSAVSSPAGGSVSPPAPLEALGEPPSAVSPPHRPKARPTEPEYRRNLPHFQAEGKTLDVTFCTAHRWELPESVRGRVLSHCLHDHGTKLHLHAAVVMPDHVHLLFTPLVDSEGNTFGLAEIMNGIKGASAHSVNRLLGRKGPVWQGESFDHILRSDERIEAKAEYICQNPVRKGLTTRPDDYQWLWREGVEGKTGETAGGGRPTLGMGETAEGGCSTLGMEGTAEGGCSTSAGETAGGGCPTSGMGETAGGGCPTLPGLKLGERAFEIAMARQITAGELQTSWFARHGSTPITEIPAHWPESYRALVQRRLDAICENPNIALIERPEYKRRWLREPWDDQVERALRSWLLDRLESDRYWPSPAHAPPELTSTSTLAERAQHDPEFLQVAALYAGRPDFPLPKLVAELVAAESVPFLPVLRYKPSGLVKRQVWERTWDLQRREDDGEDVGPIPVPPKYTSADFVSSDIWRLRGKLDVPKERFVSYPHCARDGDLSLVIGWAGWDHRQQAAALAAYYDRMKTREGWPAERLVPLLAGLDQLLFWLKLWHNEVDPEFDLRMGDYYADFVRDEAQALGHTLEQARTWTPPAKAKGGRGTKTSRPERRDEST